MALVNITINGRQLHARVGQTVLEAAAAAGIDIPALCNHPALKPEGACRVCLVEIEKQRTLQPACTFPVIEGMVVQTESEKVIAARKFALQMLFSERTHYCMVCPTSGSDHSTDCELQKLAYRYGMECWNYAPNYHKHWPVDASRKYIIMDHGRCILCRRCIRACDQIAANHALGIQQRGAKSMVTADDGLPVGTSSCVSCGTCVQICPTGALTDRRSSYMGHETEVKRTKATCMGCSVGCGVEGLTRDNVLLRIEGDWSAPNHGLLCSDGRFDACDMPLPRLKAPLLRRDGKLVEVSWSEALGAAAKRLGEAKRVAGLVSPRTINENLVAFSCFFNELLKSDEVALLYGGVPPVELGTPATLEDLPQSDCVIIVGGNPVKHQKVIAYLAKRAFDHEAKIVIVNNGSTDELDALSDMRLRLDGIAHQSASPFEMLRYTYHLRLDGIAKLRGMVEPAKRPVVLYGPNLSTAAYAALRGLSDKVKFLPLVEGTNAAGAAALGLTARAVQGDVLYVLAGDEVPSGQQLPKAEFTIVQAAYRSAWTDAADVVLPARIWSEKKGHIVNMEGRQLPVVPLLEAPKDIRADWVPLAMLSAVMGHPVLFGSMGEVQVSL